MRTTVQQKHTDGTIATLLRTALANRHDGNTKAYHQTLNTLRLAIEANIPNPEPAPPDEPEEPGLLNPPKPPTLHEPGCLLLSASSGFYIRIHEDGSASLVDGIQDITLADFTSAEIEDIAYRLNDKVGNTR